MQICQILEKLAADWLGKCFLLFPKSHINIIVSLDDGVSEHWGFQREDLEYECKERQH